MNTNASGKTQYRSFAWTLSYTHAQRNQRSKEKTAKRMLITIGQTPNFSKNWHAGQKNTSVIQSMPTIIHISVSQTTLTTHQIITKLPSDSKTPLPWTEGLTKQRCIKRQTNELQVTPKIVVQKKKPSGRGALNSSHAASEWAKQGSCQMFQMQLSSQWWMKINDHFSKTKEQKKVCKAHGSCVPNRWGRGSLAAAQS